MAYGFANFPSTGIFALETIKALANNAKENVAKAIDIANQALAKAAAAKATANKALEVANAAKRTSDEAKIIADATRAELDILLSEV